MWAVNQQEAKGQTYNPSTPHQGRKLHVRCRSRRKAIGCRILAHHQLPLQRHILKALLQDVHECPHGCANHHDQDCGKDEGLFCVGCRVSICISCRNVSIMTVVGRKLVLAKYLQKLCECPNRPLRPRREDCHEGILETSTKASALCGRPQQQ